MMEWWERLSLCMRRLWISVGERLGCRRRRTGLMKLRKEVSACEYEDVHVMWELLRKSMVHNHHQATPQPPTSSRRTRKQPWDALHWVSCGSPYHFSGSF